MNTEREAGASVLLKNVSGGDYPVAELGGIVVAHNATIDLMDSDLPAGQFYDNWNHADSLVTEPNQSQLWADIQAGGIVELVSSTAPVFSGRPG
jgi:hypothetical protein